MKKYFLISFLGFIGAFLRFYIKNLYKINIDLIFPIATLTVNILGSFLLAFTFTISNYIKVDNDLKLSITTGLFGAFTTFSTMCKDTYNLIELGEYYILISNLFISILLGLTSAYFGVYIANKIFNLKNSLNQKGNSK